MKNLFCFCNVKNKDASFCWIKNKKGEMHLPSLFLIIATLILVITALISLYSYTGDIKRTFAGPKAVDAVYIEEAELDYHLENIFDKVTNDQFFKRPINDSNILEIKQGFISRFKEELSNYINFSQTPSNLMLASTSSGKENSLIYYLKQTGDSVVNDNLVFENGKLILNPRANIVMIQKIGDKEYIRVAYPYKKKFEKAFLGSFEKNFTEEFGITVKEGESIEINMSYINPNNEDILMTLVRMYSKDNLEVSFNPSGTFIIPANGKSQVKLVVLGKKKGDYNIYISNNWGFVKEASGDSFMAKSFKNIIKVHVGEEAPVQQELNFEQILIK